MPVRTLRELPRLDASSRPELERSGVSPTDAAARLRAVVDRDYDFLWRSLRCLGLADGSVEDAAQQVLCVFARRLPDIAPGAERSFLFATAMRVASDARRAQRRRPASPVDDLEAVADDRPTAEELLDARRAHAILRDLLDALPVDLRAVFVLYEIEELTTVEIAAVVGIPAGTVASRLRRARETFQQLVRRRLAAGAHPGRGGRA